MERLALWTSLIPSQRLNLPPCYCSAQGYSDSWARYAGSRPSSSSSGSATERLPGALIRGFHNSSLAVRSCAQGRRLLLLPLSLDRRLRSNRTRHPETVIGILKFGRDTRARSAARYFRLMAPGAAAGGFAFSFCRAPRVAIGRNAIVTGVKPIRTPLVNIRTNIE